MASEATIIGTPVIYVNSLPLMGYLKEEMNSGMLFHFKDSQNVIQKVKELLLINDLKREFSENHQKLLSDKIDLTSFLVWFISSYPESAKTMHENPDFQLQFR
jgi:uncharacterized protein